MADVLTGTSLSIAISLIGHWLFLWLGFYLLSRRPRSTASKLAAAALLCVSVYMLGTSLLWMSTTRAEAVLWSRLLTQWSFFAPVLWLNTMFALTGSRMPRRRLVLTFLYAWAVALAVLGWTDTLLFDYWSAPVGVGSDAAAYGMGRLYFLFAAYLAATLALALLVLLRARRALVRSSSALVGPLGWLFAGTAAFLGGSLALLVNAYAGWPVPEGYLQPFLLAGCIMIAVAVPKYPGLVEGQLLRADLKSSLLGALLLIAVPTGLAVGAGASVGVLAAIGWIPLTVFVFHTRIRMICDRPFFDRETRQARTALLQGSRLAGSPESIDVAKLSPGQAGAVLNYMDGVERTGLAWARLARVSDQRVQLLARDEYRAVRTALGVPAGWTTDRPFPATEVEAHVAARLEPRERQAVGLKYLGYSDRQMAQSMGVKPDVPRSYLGEAKRKTDLPAGAPLMLFAFFSGVVQNDALPLLHAQEAEARVSGVGTAQAVGSPRRPTLDA